MDVLVNCEPGATAGVGPARAPRLLSAAVKGTPLVVPFPLEQVTGSTQKQLILIPQSCFIAWHSCW